MTTLLAIESSTEFASIALTIDGQILNRDLSGVQQHSQGLLPAVRQLLREADISLTQCDAIAFGCGPGAFTGVRTACGVVQGLAFGADIPVVPIVSLLAMAQAARGQEAATSVLSILDARMGEVYCAQYQYVDDVWHIRSSPRLTTLSGLTALPLDVELFALGSGVVLANEIIVLNNLNQGDVRACVPHAIQIAQLGQAAYLAGHALDAELAQPLYLRNKIALTTVERMQTKASLGERG